MIGVVATTKRDIRLGGMLVLMFVLHALFFIPYKVLDKETMLLPNLWIGSIWLAVGMDWILRYVGATIDEMDTITQLSVEVLRAGSLGLVLFSLVWNWGLVNLSGDWSARQRGEQILAQIERDALIIAYWDIAPVLEYLQLVEGRRPDIQVINRFIISEADFWSPVAQEAARRPVYVDQCLTNLRVGVRAEQRGEVYRLSAVYP